MGPGSLRRQSLIDRGRIGADSGGRLSGISRNRNVKLQPRSYICSFGAGGLEPATDESPADWSKELQVAALDRAGQSVHEQLGEPCRILE